MKTFDPILSTPDKLKVAEERQIESEKQLLGSTKRHNGHTMWEINCTTGEITPATFDEEKIRIIPDICLYTGATVGTTNVTVRDIVCNENCLYIAALNLKSAKKKYLNWLIAKQIQKLKERV